MAMLLPDVAFPLLGSSTTALGDGFPLRLVHLGGVTIDDRWRGADLCSPLWRIYANLDDGAAAVVGGRTVPFPAGAVVVVPAWLHWTPRCRGRVRHGNALVDLPGLARERIEAAADRIAIVATAGQPLAQGWHGLLAELASGAAPDAVRHARGLTLAAGALAAAFIAYGAQAVHLRPRSGLAAELAAIVDQDPARPQPVAGIARRLGLSVAELGRRCRADLGTSPARFVRARRLARAAELLRGGLPVADTAARCGFPDRTRFSKAFAAAMGCPPGAWRRRQSPG
jgi:AraC-like DNA-binding protein